MSEVESALIIGCGSIGSRHARNLSSLGIDISLFDIDRSRANFLSRRVNGDVCSSMESALTADPDTVFVTTPSNHHIDPARKAATAGCDLFVEKPISNSTNNVPNLLEIADQKNLTTMIGCNMRFHPAIQSLKGLLKNNAVGNVISARIEGGSYLPDWHPDEDYREMYSAKADIGGSLLDYIHEINYAQWSFEEIEAVTAMTGENSSLDIETEDTAALVTRTSNDVIIEFHLDYIQRDYSRSYHVIGEDGTIRWKWGDSSVRRYDPVDEIWITETTWDENWNMNQMYIDEVQHFLSCIERGDETMSPIQDGYQDLKVALAAKESASSGKHITL